MTYQELKAMVDKRKAAGWKYVSLRLTKPIKLKGFPRGELMCDQGARGQVLSFDTSRLAAWLDKNSRVAGL